MAIKINGSALAKHHEEVLKQRLLKIQSGLQNPRQPVIVSFCNTDDPPSVRYTEMKQKKAAEIGIDFRAEPFSMATPNEQLAEEIKKYNQSLKIDGIMVQLPLPDELNIFKDDLLNLINPKKDVDGLTGGPYLSATAKGVMSIFESIKIDFRQHFVVIGSLGQVGKEITRILREQSAQVTEIDSRIPSSQLSDASESDVVISCVGKSSLVLPEYIKDGSILIDVGLGEVDSKIGDFDPKCYLKASKYTPKFGGVGPMTVISLMENAVESYAGRVVE